MTETSPASWNGRVVVVTGGTRGIGYGVAGRFAERGARVMLTSRKAEAVAAAARSLPGDVVGVAAHVADEAAARSCLATALARWGPRASHRETVLPLSRP